LPGVTAGESLKGVPVTISPAAPGYQPALAASELLELYRGMLRIRMFEDRAAILYRDGRIPGFVHLSVGQEAVPVGACFALEPGDAITSTHRGHGHVLDKGLDMRGALAELFGREAGSCHGRGGSMHIADPTLSIFGANGIVGAGVPIAVGAATAARLRGDDRVAVAFFGDGAVSTGAFHEAATLAAAWQVPVALLCENNQYSEFTPTPAGPGPSTFEYRAKGYGLDFARIDGHDVEAVAIAMRQIVGGLRAGGRPVLIEAVTFRVRGHYEGDVQKYRDPEFDREWLARDPIAAVRGKLAAVGQTSLDWIDEQVKAEVEDAVEWAQAQPEPPVSALFDHVGPALAATAEPPLPPGAEPAATSSA
jgi:2-oxoisovalerate dehydrogenase E1 component